MGMSDNQWYGDLRNQLDNWEQVRDFLDVPELRENENVQKALARVQKNIDRINENLEK